jgi:hypothetical protein
MTTQKPTFLHFTTLYLILSIAPPRSAGGKPIRISRLSLSRRSQQDQNNHLPQALTGTAATLF